MESPREYAAILDHTTAEAGRRAVRHVRLGMLRTWRLPIALGVIGVAGLVGFDSGLPLALAVLGILGWLTWLLRRDRLALTGVSVPTVCTHLFHDTHLERRWEGSGRVQLLPWAAVGRVRREPWSIALGPRDVPGVVLEIGRSLVPFPAELFPEDEVARLLSAPRCERWSLEESAGVDVDWQASYDAPGGGRWRQGLVGDVVVIESPWSVDLVPFEEVVEWLRAGDRLTLRGETFDMVVPAALFPAAGGDAAAGDLG